MWGPVSTWTVLGPLGEWALHLLMPAGRTDFFSRTIFISKLTPGLFSQSLKTADHIWKFISNIILLGNIVL